MYSRKLNLHRGFFAALLLGLLLLDMIFVTPTALAQQPSASVNHVTCSTQTDSIDIEFDLDLAGRVGQTLTVFAFARDMETDDLILSDDPTYSDKNGILVVWDEVTLSKTNTHLDNFLLAVPYSAFSSGEYTFTFIISVADANMDILMQYKADECSYRHTDTPSLAPTLTPTPTPAAAAANDDCAAQCEGWTGDLWTTCYDGCVSTGGTWGASSDSFDDFFNSTVPTLPPSTGGTWGDSSSDSFDDFFNSTVPAFPPSTGGTNPSTTSGSAGQCAILKDTLRREQNLLDDLDEQGPASLYSLELSRQQMMLQLQTQIDNLNLQIIQLGCK